MVRACSTKVMLLAQQQEFVVDLFRMRDQQVGILWPRPDVQLHCSSFAASCHQANGEEMKDPMARFSGDWETEFVPDYKSVLATFAPAVTNRAHSP